MISSLEEKRLDVCNGSKNSVRSARLKIYSEDLSLYSY